MIHRALLGSLERFIGILIEHYAGHFPLWLAPVQIVLMGISERQHEHINKMKTRLEAEGFTVIADNRSERINFKIREHSHQKIPVIGVFGDREVENNTVTVRRFGSNKQTTMGMDEFVESLKLEVQNKQ